MKVVLRHINTGRYYQSPGQWVRRADNARAFDDVGAAREFSRHNHVLLSEPVFRLAPYLMPLLLQPQPTIWAQWTRFTINQHPESASQFSQN